jgi:hypothetical protein
MGSSQIRQPSSSASLTSQANSLHRTWAATRYRDAVWALTIGGQPIAGRWVIIDRQFRPAQ